QRAVLVGEAVDVGDPAGRLENEAERLGHLHRPVQQHFLLRNAIEGVVDLDRGQSGSVVAEHAVRRKVGRIEGALPLLVGPAAGADADVHVTPSVILSAARVPGNGSSAVRPSPLAALGTTGLTGPPDYGATSNLYALRCRRAAARLPACSYSRARLKCASAKASSASTAL